MDLKIIFKIEKNIEIITKLNKYVHDFHVKNHPNIFNPYDYNIIYEVIKDMLSQDNVYSIIVYNDLDPIGYSLLTEREYKQKIFKSDHKSIYIDQMCIINEYQNKGIGAKLIKFIKKFCLEKNIKRLELSVWVDNYKAINFYKKIGFENYLNNMKIDL